MLAYVEYGIDFDNNRFGLGKSVELELATGEEYRIKANINLMDKSFYTRFWIGKYVFSYSKSSGFKIKKKTRNNFKFVFGVCGLMRPSIHLMCGFMGFGKTTLANNLKSSLPAVLFSPDEIMLSRFGRTPDNFEQNYKNVDEYIKNKTIECVKKGKSVILDYGFWGKLQRKEYYNWAKKLTKNVILHVLECDINVAKERVLNRTQNNPKELYIDASCFDDRLKLYEKYDRSEKYPIVIFHQM